MCKRESMREEVWTFLEVLLEAETVMDRRVGKKTPAGDRGASVASLKLRVQSCSCEDGCQDELYKLNMLSL